MSPLQRLWTLVAGFVLFSQNTMTQTKVCDINLRTRNGLGLTALVEAQRTLMPGTTPTPDPIRNQESATCAIVRMCPDSDNSRLGSIDSIGPTFIPSLASVRLSKRFLGLHRIKATCGSVYILHNPLKTFQTTRTLNHSQHVPRKCTFLRAH